MSRLTKANKAQKSAAKQEHGSFNVCAISVIKSLYNDRGEWAQPDLAQYLDRAAVPAYDTTAKDVESRQACKDYARENISGLLPAVCVGGSWSHVVFTRNKKHAAQFVEGRTSAESFRGCGDLSAEFGAATGENGALRSVYFFRTIQERKPIILHDNGAAGKVYKTTDDGKSRVFETVNVREYVAYRGGVYTIAEIYDAFAVFFGIPQAIAAEHAEAMQLRAAKLLQGANVAAAKASAAAAAVAEQAKAAKAKAAETKKKAAETAAAVGMSAEQAAEIVSKAESKKAAEQGEQAEQASKAKGENVRKKANTRTKASEQVTTK